MKNKMPIIVAALITFALLIEFVVIYTVMERRCTKNIIEKPVLYLYPEEETDVRVRINSNDLTVSYPEYQDGWDVKASPDGTLVGKDSRNYGYLFWEYRNSSFEPDFSRGFCVRGCDAVGFLEEKLGHMGLSDKETGDFITYWVPRMGGNPYNIISFQFDGYEDYENLRISPEPDSVVRAVMAFYPLERPVDIPVQELPCFERKGFTAVEWGGMEVKK